MINDDKYIINELTNDGSEYKKSGNHKKRVS